jgi:hypothetical protein
MDLVAGTAVERTAAVRADLGLDPQPSQNREGPPGDGGRGDVEMERQLTATAKVNRSRSVEQSRELRETIAPSGWRDRRQLGADAIDEGGLAQSSIPSSRSRSRFVTMPASP